MSSPIVSLTDLAQQCAQETDRFFRDEAYDPRHCFELFRRAVVERDERAWEAVYAQYTPLVGRWIRQHPGFEMSGEEMQYFINRAFEKIWAALTPEKFGQFPDLGFLLRYLKMCVHSAISDHNRSIELMAKVRLDEGPTFEIEDPAQGPEERAFGRIQRLRFWEALVERLHDEKERQAIYGSYMLALKPGELVDAFPGLFADADEVYRVKQNVLARLRRDVELGEMLALSD